MRNLNLIQLVIAVAMLCGGVVAEAQVSEHGVGLEARMGADELPERSDYGLFDRAERSVGEHELRDGYHPIQYSWGGSRRFRLGVYGYDVADGIDPSAVARGAIGMRHVLPLDTLQGAWFRSGRRSYQLSASPSFGHQRRFAVWGAATSSAAGASVHLAEGNEEGGYDLRLRASGGPSIYGAGVESYGATVSLVAYHKGWSLMLFAAPSARAVRTASVDEAFELGGSMLYNPSCGVWQGRLRNAAWRREYLPVAAVSREWSVGRHRFRLSAVGRVGERSRQALTWNNDLSPYPDHYRALPSWAQSELAAEQIEQLWTDGYKGGAGVPWEALYAVNRASREAAYMLTSRVERMVSGALSAEVRGGSDHWRYTARAAVRCDRSAMFRRIDDLLGASHALNIDYYESDIAAGRVVLADERSGQGQLGEGDRVDYNYLLTRLQGAAEVHAAYTGNDGLGLEINARSGVSSLRRRGLWQKSGHREGYGRSSWNTWFEGEVDVALHYKGALLRLWCATEPPEADDIYIAPEHSSEVARHATPTRYGLRAEYTLRSGGFGATAAAMIWGTGGGSRVRHYYDDIISTYANMVVSDIRTMGFGLDMDADYEISRYWRLSASVAWMRERYTADPTVDIYADVDGMPLVKGARTAVNGMFCTSTPQLALRAGVAGALGDWTLDAQVGFYGGRYIEPAPLLRMTRVKEILTHEEYARIAPTQRLGNLATASLELRRTIYLDALRIIAALTAEGLIAGDHTSYAYEQMRLYRHSASGQMQFRPAPLRRLYAYPFTATLRLTFVL